MTQELKKVLTIEAEAENEWIAGVPQKVLFNGIYWKGFREASEKEMFDLVSQNLEFRPRNEDLEKDETFKQIIPYFLIRKDNKYYSSIRKPGEGDVRLHGARLIGFGGHLRKEDIVGPMEKWLEREFSEEVKADKVRGISFLGIVNDDEDPRGVSQVHFGLVFVVDVSGKVLLREEDKFEAGIFFSTIELKTLSKEMESWSQLITEGLK